MIEYSSSRLCFKADVIEPLNNYDIFAVHTPCGVFQMTKAELYIPQYCKNRELSERKIV